MDRLAEGLALEWPFSHFAWVTGMSVDHLDSVLSPSYSGQANSIDDTSNQAIKHHFVRMKDRASNSMNLLSGLYARLYLASGVLQKVDRASMAHGLEVRAPFLSKNMIETAMGLSPSMKCSRGQTKRVLRSIASDLNLPKGVDKRPKKGFGIPVSEWLKGPLKGYAEDLLLGSNVEESGVLNRQGISKLWSLHLDGKADHRKNLWPLLCFRAWEERSKKES